MDSYERFDETEFPSRDKFFSTLSNEQLSNNRYDHAKKVWTDLECNTLGDYHDLYLATDVLLLADVFENFRLTSLESYKLDPCHYYTAPGLGWGRHVKND